MSQGQWSETVRRLHLNYKKRKIKYFVQKKVSSIRNLLINF